MVSDTRGKTAEYTVLKGTTSLETSHDPKSLIDRQE